MRGAAAAAAARGSGRFIARTLWVAAPLLDVHKHRALVLECEAPQR